MATSKPARDKRNILRVTRFPWLRATGVTAAMVDRVRQRITAAGGTLAIWAVLREDVYESAFGDGCYLHLRGIALNPHDAERLVALAPEALFVGWHIKPYVLVLDADVPRLRDSWPASEEFTIADVVQVLAEILPGGTASSLLTGPGVPGRSEPGAHLLSLPVSDPDPDPADP